VEIIKLVLSKRFSMSKHLLAFQFFISILILISCKNFRSPSPDEHLLWPDIEPYETNYFKVSEIHELYYEQCGNPNGKPVMVLHGGPGGMASPGMRRYFNPEIWRIVLFDQRGAGRSKPWAEINDNHTQALVEDIEMLRKKLGIDRMVLFGGSWGSTLALAYAETYPQYVSGMILRGIWTATQDEIEHFYHGGAAKFYPGAYDDLLASIPDTDWDYLPEYLSELLQHGDSLTKKRVADAWLRYEWLISDIRVDTAEVERSIRNHSAYGFSLLENYYMANQCFLEEGQLWDHLSRITHIPCVIINGRFDMACPPSAAYRLHQHWPGSELVIVELDGHFGPGIKQALLEAVVKME
jgi:proline iminopeptidase